MPFVDGAGGRNRGIAVGIFCVADTLDSASTAPPASTDGAATLGCVVATDAVTARSQADPTKSASATITVAVPHSVSLSWSPSISSGVSYSMYRGNSTGGPYTLLKGRVSSTSYVDLSVLAGRTYYYVATAVDSRGRESVPSGEVQAAIPTP